jgi:cytochrome c oxidase subunit 4
MAGFEMSEANESPEKREQSLLNLICLIAAALFLALVAYNLFAAGSVISTDGLFFTVVPLLLAFVFLVVPGLDMWKKRREAKASAASSESSEVAEANAHAQAVMELEEDIHFAGSNRLFLSIWLWLLLLTGFEVFLGYIRLPVVYMLVILMGASIVKAALIVAYFMHLRFERLNLILTIVPAVVIAICLLLVFFPDSFRAKNLRYSGPPATSGSEAQP